MSSHVLPRSDKIGRQVLDTRVLSSNGPRYPQIPQDMVAGVHYCAAHLPSLHAIEFIDLSSSDDVLEC